MQRSVARLDACYKNRLIYMTRIFQFQIRFCLICFGLRVSIFLAVVGDAIRETMLRIEDGHQESEILFSLGTQIVAHHESIDQGVLYRHVTCGVRLACASCDTGTVYCHQHTRNILPKDSIVEVNTILDPTTTSSTSEDNKKKGGKIYISILY